ncbi:hypothetical protein HY386_00165 [Candidatus Daviesbacteria bacterium]|nr:hypothetical protein [Candidatus Daviesbacteria bacterium]
MNRDDFKKLLEEALEPIKQKQGSHSAILEKHSAILESHSAILEKHSAILESHSAALMRIESILLGYADSYKVNQQNIERLDDRLSNVEEKMDIEVPEDLKVPHFSAK